MAEKTKRKLSAGEWGRERELKYNSSWTSELNGGEKVRGQCQRSYFRDSPALSVICKLGTRLSHFTVGLMLGHCCFYTLSHSDSVVSIKRSVFLAH